MTIACHVLVIDGPSETADVLQAVLEPRGTVVQRTRRQSLSPSDTFPGSADVVVLDMDDPASVAGLSDESLRTTPQIHIGSDRVMIDDSKTRFLQKPFQFPELIQAVEDLLAETARRAA